MCFSCYYVWMHGRMYPPRWNVVRTVYGHIVWLQSAVTKTDLHDIIFLCLFLVTK